MKIVNPLLGLLVASLINAVPSNDALHPIRAVCDLDEADLAGSGREVSVADIVIRASFHDDTKDQDPRYWRSMAQRCRSLAVWQNQDAREVLIRLAEEYEERARQAARLTQQKDPEI